MNSVERFQQLDMHHLDLDKEYHDVETKKKLGLGLPDFSIGPLPARYIPYLPVPASYLYDYLPLVK